MSTEAPLLRLDNITRNFGAIEALKGISFDIHRGEVVALLGDNGAGKSTLVKIISGVLPATSGKIFFDGREVAFSSPTEAKGAGIETVYQDLSLCTNVDVVANFFMGREIVKRYFGIPRITSYNVCYTKLLRDGLRISFKLLPVQSPEVKGTV